MSELGKDIKTKKRVCALTIVRNDNFFLEKWVTYYGKELGRENLYVFMDGTDQEVPDFCKDICVTHKEKIYYDSVIESEKRRLAYLSSQAEKLFKSYDIVIGTDADEFLIVDPDLNISLGDYLGNYNKGGACVSGLGIDVGQNLNLESEIDLNEPLLGQRRFGFLSTRYTKPNTLLRPAKWGSGFHRVKGHNYKIDKNLFLFHFGSMDYKKLEERNRANGWSERHLRKRASTIYIITKHKAKEWKKTTKWVRIMQTFNRQIYALNKPSMMKIKVVVEIPDKFKGII